MKFAFKPWLMAAAFVATNAANAAAGYEWSVTSGNAAIVFNSTVLRNAAITTPAVIPVQPDLPNGGGINTAIFTKAKGTVDLALSGGATSGDTLTSLQADDAVIRFRRVIFNENDDEFDIHTVFLNNLGIDLATSTVYADVSTWYQHMPSYATPQPVILGKLAVFSFDEAGVSGSMHGNTVVDTTTGQGQATGTTDSLMLKAEVADLFFEGLGLKPINGNSDTIQQLRLQSWGTLSFQATLSGTPAVPEPSSHALIGAGLAALCLAKRKRVGSRSIPANS